MLLPSACLKRYFLKVLQRLSEFVYHYYIECEILPQLKLAKSSFLSIYIVILGKGRRKKPPVGKPGVGVDASKVVKSFTKSRGGPTAKTNSIYDNTATNNSQNVRVTVPIEEFLIQVIIIEHYLCPDH